MDTAADGPSACCLSNVKPLALGKPLLLDLLWLEAALQGDAAARDAGLSVVHGALVRCKRSGQYSWQQIRHALRQPDGSWDLHLVQEGQGASLKASWVSNAGVHPEEAGQEAELRELSTRWPTLLCNRQQVALTSWRLEGSQKLLAKILQRQGRAPDGSVPVNSYALDALVKTLQSQGGFRNCLGRVVGAAVAGEGGAAAVQGQQPQQQQGLAQPHQAQVGQLQYATLAQVVVEQQQQAQAAQAKQREQQQLGPPPPPQAQQSQEYKPVSAASEPQQQQQQQPEVAPSRSGALGVSTSEASVTVDGRQLPPMPACALAKPAKPSMLSSAGSPQRAGGKEAGAPTTAVGSDHAAVAAAAAAAAGPAVTCSSAGTAAVAGTAAEELQGAAAVAGECPPNPLASLDRLLEIVTKQGREAPLASAAELGQNVAQSAPAAAQGAAGAARGAVAGEPTGSAAKAGAKAAAAGATRRALEAAVGSAVMDLSDSLASLPQAPSSPAAAAAAGPQLRPAGPEVADCPPLSSCKWQLGQASQEGAADTAARVSGGKATEPALHPASPPGAGVLQQQLELAAVTMPPGFPAATKSPPSKPHAVGSPGQASGSKRAGESGHTGHNTSQVAPKALTKGSPHSTGHSGGREGSASRSRSRSDRKRRRRSLSRGSSRSRGRRRSRSSSCGRRRSHSSSRRRDRSFPVLRLRSPSSGAAAIRRLPRSVQDAIYDLVEGLNGQLRPRDFDDGVVTYMLTLHSEEALVRWVSRLQENFRGPLRNPAAWLMAQLKHTLRAQSHARC